MSQLPPSGQQSGKVQIIIAIIGAAAVIIAAIIAVVPPLVEKLPPPASPTTAPTSSPSQQPTQPSNQATQNPQSTSTTLPTPTRRTQAFPLKNPPLPLRLSCTCDDPVTVTITAITVDSTAGHMIWKLSFQNVSGAPQRYGLGFFYLQQASINGNNKMYGTGDAIATQTSCNVYTGDYLQPGQTVQKSIIFSFIPVANTQYTLMSMLFCPIVTFNPVTLTF
jgi:hypothetical protein